MESYYISKRRPLATPLATAQTRADKFFRECSVSTGIEHTGTGTFVTLADTIQVLFEPGDVIKLVVNERVIASSETTDPDDFLTADFKGHRLMTVTWQGAPVCQVRLHRGALRIEGADGETQSGERNLSNLEAAIIYWSLNMSDTWTLERYEVPVVDMDLLFTDAREFAQKVLEG